jgi:hypothetical protein
MEKFRTRFATAGQPRMLLLPLSMGVSSLALLHCLDEQLKRQIENTGRTGFGLQVLHVDTTAIVPNTHIHRHPPLLGHGSRKHPRPAQTIQHRNL